MRKHTATDLTTGLANARTGTSGWASMPAEIEARLRANVLDCVPPAPGARHAQLIIGNRDTACVGKYYVLPGGVRFVFHHGNGPFVTKCGCMIQGGPGARTWGLPRVLAGYRSCLIAGARVEPKLAAMVTMKLFLGLEVPEPFNELFREVLGREEGVETTPTMTSDQQRTRLMRGEDGMEEGMEVRETDRTQPTEDGIVSEASTEFCPHVPTT